MSPRTQRSTPRHPSTSRPGNPSAGAPLRGIPAWLLTIMLLAGCAMVPAGETPSSASSSPLSSAPSSTSSTAPSRAAPSPAFDIAGAVDRPGRFDLAALQALPSSSVTVAGHTYVGVPLWSLLTRQAAARVAAKNATLTMMVVATGSDGFRAVLALAEIDPDFGNRPAIVAYQVDGQPLGRAGVARLVVPGDTKMGRSVFNLARIEVVDIR